MDNAPARATSGNLRAVRYLTYLMFFMFAMTTDSVGLVIPQVIAEFGLSLTKAGALHYGSMAGIAGAGLCLGFLADRLGRKRAILAGLGLFSVTAYCVPLTQTFAQVLLLISLAGVAIGIFKSAAVALVADMSSSPTALTSTMNLVEGYFGLGAIIGPLVLGVLVARGVSWRWLYSIAGTLCLLLILTALNARYPTHVRRNASNRPGFLDTLRLLRNPYAVGFGLAAFSYVAVECAIYVWMPTLLSDYRGRWATLTLRALPAFFMLRALGRFIGAWLLHYLDWTKVLAICSAAIFACFVASTAGGIEVALFLLPLSGLFMSVLYPTINSKGVACFTAPEQGAVAGIILFFTCSGAVIGPLAMGVVGDIFGGAKAGFLLATVFAGVLAAGLLLNVLLQPARAQLARISTEFQAS